VAREWADRYAGQFDDGWDAYRERTLARQKELGVMPADTELSRHDPDVPEWASLSLDARRLAARMTERPQVAEQRAQYIYRPHTQTLPFWVGPRVLNRPHSITADAEIPDRGAEGVLSAPRGAGVSDGGARPPFLCRRSGGVKLEEV